MSNHAETDKVLALVVKNLDTAYQTLAALKQEQSLIDQKIEDLTRVTLALERTKNTLSANGNGISLEESFDASLREEAEDVYHRALAKADDAA